MADSIWEREIMLDLVVNAVPLVIIAFFTVAFVLFNQWPQGDFLGRLLQFGLLVVPFVGLALLTYMAAKQIE